MSLVCRHFALSCASLLSRHAIQQHPTGKEQAMTQAVKERTTGNAPPRSGAVNRKPEIFVTPLSDVDRPKAFYSKLGWRLDAVFAGEGGRVIQSPPPGSPASVIFGKNVTAAAPGSA